MMNTIQVRARHATTDEVTDDVYFVAHLQWELEGVTMKNAQEIRPESAVAIASWWQSSGTVGSVLAGFASGAEVDREELLDDIAATRQAEGYHGYPGRQMPKDDRDALDCLATFVLNHGRER
jgi:hypothetical protein